MSLNRIKKSFVRTNARIKQKTGRMDKTVDEEYDLLLANLRQFSHNTSEIAKSIKALPELIKKLYNTTEKMKDLSLKLDETQMDILEEPEISSFEGAYSSLSSLNSYLIKIYKSSEQRDELLIDHDIALSEGKIDEGTYENYNQQLKKEINLFLESRIQLLKPILGATVINVHDAFKVQPNRIQKTEEQFLEIDNILEDIGHISIVQNK